MRTALFLEGPQGPLFAYRRQPAAARDAVLLIPPFAEELNKSRRMLSLVGEALADAGLASLLPDLHGTGDSAGEFAEASWDGWLAELDCAAEHLESRGTPVTAVLALRGGALLAAEWLARRPCRAHRLVLWQPVTSGELWLNQFLRLRSAAAVLAGREEPVRVLRQALARGEALEIAGYTLTPGLAASLERRRLGELPPPAGTRVLAFELGPDDVPLSPALQELLTLWRTRGLAAEGERLSGEPFWSSQEIATCPALVAASVAVLTEET